MGWQRAQWWARLKWVFTTGVLAAALSAWWVLPFWWQRGYLNDMGWGKERRYMSALWSRSEFDYSFLTNHPPLQLFVSVSAAGLLVFGAVRLYGRFRLRLRRLGTNGKTTPADVASIGLGTRLWLALSVTAAIFALAFWLLPEGRLWNVRILPFYYLTVYLTAALGVGKGLHYLRSLVTTLRRQQAVSGADSRPIVRLGTRLASVTVFALMVVPAVALVVLVALPLRGLPGGGIDETGAYRWGPFSTTETNPGTYWVQYNFEGYESRIATEAGGGYGEYRYLVDTMSAVGDSLGCGPALWEYQLERIGTYGTPMAPMLLPHWTDGCIGSMEGLYFEASATVSLPLLDAI